MALLPGTNGPPLVWGDCVLHMLSWKVLPICLQIYRRYYIKTRSIAIIQQHEKFRHVGIVIPIITVIILTSQWGRDNSPRYRLIGNLPNLSWSCVNCDIFYTACIFEYKMTNIGKVIQSSGKCPTNPRLFLQRHFWDGSESIFLSCLIDLHQPHSRYWGI